MGLCKFLYGCRLSDDERARNAAMLLREYLKENEISVDEFAAAIDCSRGAVLKWQSGERYPRVPQLLAISKETNGEVTANDFTAQQVQQQKN